SVINEPTPLHRNNSRHERGRTYIIMDGRSSSVQLLDRTRPATRQAIVATGGRFRGDVAVPAPREEHEWRFVMAWIGVAVAVVLIGVVLIDTFEVMILPRRVRH